MKKKSILAVLIFLMATFLLIGCSGNHEITVGQVAWRVLADGSIETQTSGTVNTRDFRISPILELGPDQVAVGVDNRILGPGGSYPNEPNPQEGFRLWTIEPAFYTDGTITGIAGVPHPNSANELQYEMLDQPGYHPYPASQVRKFINGPIQIRLQTTEILDPTTGKTGLDICRENATNDVCDGSITGLILSSADPAVKGSMDIDFIAYWDFSDPGALWAIGDPYEFIVKMTINKVRSLRSIASGITPLDFVNSNEVENFLVVEITDVVNTNLESYPLKISETRVRGRYHTITPIQQAEADHQANMQNLANNQAEIAAKLERDQAQVDATTTLALKQIESDQLIAAAQQTAIVDHLQWEREQAGLDDEAGLGYVNCVRHLYDLQQFDSQGKLIAGPSGEEMIALIIGCMPEASIQAFNQMNPESAIFINPVASPQPTQ